MLHSGPVQWTHTLSIILIIIVEGFKDRVTIRVRHREWCSLFFNWIIIMYHRDQGLVVFCKTHKNRLYCLLLSNLSADLGGGNHETGTSCLNHFTIIETNILLLDWGRWLRIFFSFF